jgi:paraquat-inducible protein B
LRAQLRPASLLSGDVYVAIDFFPGSPAKVNWAASPPEFPTQKASIVELREAVASIATKLGRMPLDELSGDLRETLQAATRVLNTADASIAPELRNTAAEVRKTLAAVDRALASDSPLQTDTRQAMRDVARAAQAIRVLADYLERHPEALVMGKKQEAVQ